MRRSLRDAVRPVSRGWVKRRKALGLNRRDAEILRRRKAGTSVADLAREFGLSRMGVWLALRNYAGRAS